MSSPERLQISGLSRIVEKQSTSNRLKENWHLFLCGLAQIVYNLRPEVSPPLISTSSITVVAISDTHNQNPMLPDGNFLLHAGNLTRRGTFDELQDQIDWLDSQSHPLKIVIADLALSAIAKLINGV